MRHLSLVDSEDLRKLCYLALTHKKHVKVPPGDNYYANAVRTSEKLVRRVCKNCKFEIEETKGKIRIKSKENDAE